MTYNLKYINDKNEVVEFSWESKITISDSGSLFTGRNITLSTSQGFNQVGTTVQGRSVNDLDVVILGEILGETKASRELLLNTILPGRTGKIVWNDLWEIDVEITQSPHIELYPQNAKFSFGIKAPYPYWRMVQGEIDILGGVKPLFEFLDLTKPFAFGERITELFTNVKNRGNIDIPFIVIFTAMDNLSNPQITNATTYEFLRIIRDMVVGEIITVDLTKRPISITSNIGGSITDAFGNIDIMSTLYRLHPGDNILRYDADINRDGLDVKMSRNTESVAVYD